MQERLDFSVTLYHVLVEEGAREIENIMVLMVLVRIGLTRVRLLLRM